MAENQRTSILIEDGEKGAIRVKLTRTPGGGPGRSTELSPLDQRLSLTEATEEHARGYGAALHQTLCSEKGLKAAVRDALRAGDGDVRPLCFKIEGGPGLVDEWMWEALWVKGKEFLALRPQWPIARIVDTESTARVYHAPVRVLAIMSALDVSARGDWEGIRRAVEMARRLRPGGRDEDRLPVHVTAIVGELALLAEMRKLQAKLEAERDNWLTVVGLDGQQTIDDHLADEPHIVHFFCHGRVEYGGGLLSLATMSDRAEEDPALARESVTVDLSRLRRLVNGRKLWLVTLNCCSGAHSEGPIQSLAHATVEAGAGAALGWRTPIAPEKAHLLCQTVYAALFQQLREQLNHARREETVLVELATLGYYLRDALHDQDRDLLTWALPVFYVAQEPLAVMVAASQPDDREDLTKTDVSPLDQQVITDSVEMQVLRQATQGNPVLAEGLRATLGADLRPRSGDEGTHRPPP